jgi:signal transduction histidine kinase
MIDAQSNDAICTHADNGSGRITAGDSMPKHDRRSKQEMVMRSLLLAWARAALIWTATVAYLLGFAPLYDIWGAGVAALSALPVVMAGFLLGLRAGLIIGLLSLPVNALLLHLAGLPVEDVLSAEYGSWPMMVVLIGVVSGWLRNLLERITRQADQLAAERAALTEQTAERERAETVRRAFERKLLEMQKLESLGLIAGGIAHDFNNLLMAVLGHAELVARELPPESLARESIRVIETAAQRAADLTKQLLAYGGQAELTVAPLDLNALISETVRLLRVSISKTVTVDFHLATHLPLIVADTTQIRHLVMTLMVNAAEAIGDMEGVISLTTGVRHAGADRSSADPASDLRDGDDVYLELADTGCGMEPATLERIFDPFFSTKTTGCGLGLAAVRGIVHGHGGTLEVASQPGRGTTFMVRFPQTTSATE